LLVPHAVSRAQEPPRQQHDDDASSAPEVAADPIPSLAAFVDGVMQGLMQARHVPGAVALMVQDGRVTFERGYGLADPGTGRPIDPEKTLFRVASISKLITATAAMQLVEQGKLDLGADLNRYFEGFAIRNRFGRPITLGHLLTHTGGLQDSASRWTQALGEAPIPLRSYLAAHVPEPVRAPADLISYSNVGFTLVGYLVERASRQPFARYVEQHILEPLKMTHSGFGLPRPLPSDMAVGTYWTGERYLATGYDRLLMGPAGDFYTSATDIARFMLAHLQNGRIADGSRLLADDTTRMMHAQHFTQHPRLTGWAYGFQENVRNGHRTLEHSGSWRGFGARLVLVPEKQLGLFVSTTRSYDPRFFDPLLVSFFDRVLPPGRPLAFPAPLRGAGERAHRYTGTYIANRRVHNDNLKLGLFEDEITVTANDDGTLRIRWPGDSRDSTRMVEIAPALFQREDDGHIVGFRTDADGRATHLFADSLAMEHLAWWERPTVQGFGAVVCGLFFFITMLAYGFGALVPRVSRRPANTLPVAARSIAVAFASFGLLSLLRLATSISRTHALPLIEQMPLWLTMSAVVPRIAVVLSFGLPIALACSVFSGSWTSLHRLHFLFLTLAAGYFGWFCWTWNLLEMSR
jgi:CubicO group peptidase (beta-lactamase class C family)